MPRHPALAGGRRPLAGPAWHQRRPRRAGGRHAPAPHRQDRAPRDPRQPLPDPSAALPVSRRRRPSTPLTRGLGASFDIEDEPYFIELQDPASTQILLTADYGPDAVSSAIGTLYASDTSLQPDGRTRVLGYTARSRQRRRDLLCAWPLPQPGQPRRPRPRSNGHDAGHLSGAWETQRSRRCATPSPGAWVLTGPRAGAVADQVESIGSTVIASAARQFRQHRESASLRSQ